jgi:hypothetical protein
MSKSSCAGFRAHVITVSDRCFAGEAEDLGGPAVIARLGPLGFDAVTHTTVPDDADMIQSAIRGGMAEHGAALILTTGGTGFAVSSSVYLLATRDFKTLLHMHFSKYTIGIFAVAEPSFGHTGLDTTRFFADIDTLFFFFFFFFLPQAARCDPRSRGGAD